MQQLITAIQERQVQRIAAMKSMLRIQNQARALVRRSLGWQWDMDEKERNKINKQAEKLVSGVWAGQKHADTPPASAGPYTNFLIVAQQAYKIFEAVRTSYEKDMIREAKALPVAAFVEQAKGFGYLGLAIIVGEAGNLSDYDSVAKLWKRFGIGVLEGRAQRKVTDPEMAIKMGYNPRRRSALWTIGDALIKSGGEYKVIYDDRKVYETPRVKTKMHAHRRAQRYMEKRLLRNLWNAWRDTATEKVTTRGRMPEPAVA